MLKSLLTLYKILSSTLLSMEHVAVHFQLQFYSHIWQAANADWQLQAAA